MPTLCVKRDNWQLLSDKTIIVIITPDTVTAAKGYIKEPDND